MNLNNPPPNYGIPFFNWVKESILSIRRRLNGAEQGNNNQMFLNASGNTSSVIPAGKWLLSLAAIANNHSEMINIGTTPGGTDIATSFPLITTDYTSVNVNRYFRNNQIIYITGATGSVTYNFLTD